MLYYPDFKPKAFTTFAPFKQRIHGRRECLIERPSRAALASLANCAIPFARAKSHSAVVMREVSLSSRTALR